MPSENINIKLFDMVLCISRALDLLHATISDHHLRVAYIGACLAEQLGLGPEERQDVLIAGALHDVAAISSTVRLTLLDYVLTSYQPDSTRIPESLHDHGLAGYLLLRDFAPFANAASAIRFHHIDWNFGEGDVFIGSTVPHISHILHLADRIAVLPSSSDNILEQVATIRATINADSGRRYMPEVVAAFGEISNRESFWLDLVNQHKADIIRRRFGAHQVSLDLDSLYALARVLARIIDYRSPFTVAHSSGVAATAKALAMRLGMTPRRARLIGIAGYLHDIGKLAVPPEILDKQGKLSAAEMLVIKQHPYHTHQILAMVPGLETINTWASLHHERLDGNGYPFHTRDIPFGARIIAVADIFTAITEHRPYRMGMQRTQALEILDRLVQEKAIDGEVVTVLRNNFDELHQIRSLSQPHEPKPDADPVKALHNQ